MRGELGVQGHATHHPAVALAPCAHSPQPTEFEQVFRRLLWRSFRLHLLLCPLALALLGAVLGGEQSPAASLPCRRAPRALSLPWQHVKGCFVQRAQRRLVPLAAARRPLAGGLQGGEEQGHEGTALPPQCQRPSCILSP